MKSCSHLIRVLLAVMLTLGWALPATADNLLPSAKAALALANQKVDTEVQDRVIRIVGSKSNTDLKPRVWEITMYDTNRVNDGVLVRVKDGAVSTIASSMRMFDDGRWKNFSRNFSGYWPEEIIDVSRWAIDSDRVIESVRSHPKLGGYQVTEVTLVLRKLSDGEVPPHWRIRVRARPQDNPSRERWVGYLQYNAESGDLLKDELTIGN